MARRATEDEDNSFTGKFDVKKFENAVTEIEEAHQIPKEQIYDILKKAIDKAGRDTLYPNPKMDMDSAKSMHSDTEIDEVTGEISFYECKDVVANDAVEDDLYQIEEDEAQEIDPNLKVGDVYKNKIDFTTIDYSFYTRAIQNFMQSLKAATKQALIDRYSDRIGQIVTGIVEKVDGRYTTISMNKIQATLTSQNAIPGEQFTPGETVKVLLKGIGTTEEGGDKATSLILSRTDDNFLRRLFEQEIPDIADGSVTINGIVREPGLRAKVAVSSSSPDVDPTGACIGSDGSRIKDICTQLGNEKIDVIKYQDNPYLYIAEALKPATVVGVLIKDEPVEPGKAPKAVAIVKNSESKIAIGKKGVNVRLASRLTGFSIDIKEQDVAMSDHISYTNIDDIKRKLALERLDQEEVTQPLDEDMTPEEMEEAPSQEETEAPVAQEEVKQDTVKPVEGETAPAETVAAPAAEETKPVAEPVKEVAKPVEEKKDTFDTTHVEITTKAKISLDKLEEQIEAEKKNSKNPTQPHYFHKPYIKKDDDFKKKDETVKKPAVANAMPIYTEEELKAMNEEEKEQESNTQTGTDSEDYEEYDDDQYYENDTEKK